MAAPRSAGAKGSGGTLGLRESELQILCLCGDLETGGPTLLPARAPQGAERLSLLGTKHLCAEARPVLARRCAASRPHGGDPTGETPTQAAPPAAGLCRAWHPTGSDGAELKHVTNTPSSGLPASPGGAPEGAQGPSSVVRGYLGVVFHCLLRHRSRAAASSCSAPFCLLSLTPPPYPTQPPLPWAEPA